MIPEISDDRLYDLMRRIVPVVRFARTGVGFVQSENGKTYLIEECDPRTAGFNVNPKRTNKMMGIAEIYRFKSFHSISPNFCPSIAEVLAQIPGKYLSITTHFETIREDPQPKKPYGGKEYFVATSVLYTTRD